MMFIISLNEVLGDIIHAILHSAMMFIISLNEVRGDIIHAILHSAMMFIISLNEVLGDIIHAILHSAMMFIISLNEVRGDIIVLELSPRPPIDLDDVNTLNLKNSTNLFQILYVGRYPSEVHCY